MLPRYFTGQTLYGDVCAHHAQTFASMVNQLIMVPQVLPIRGIAYHGLRAKAADRTQPREVWAAAKAACDKAKEVPYLTPGVFNASPSPRQTQHVTHCNLICIDIDTGGGFLIQNTDLLPRQLAPWSYVAYQTASSTPTSPRMRVIVDAEAIEPGDYIAAVKTIAERIGLAEVTPESLKVHQPMYLPSVFSDSSEAEHPVFSHRTDGKAFTVFDIAGPELPTATTERTAPVRRPGATLDLLECLRAPVDGVTLQIVEEALGFIDPDLPRDEWLDVAAAMRHQFGDGYDEEAYEAFDAWSSKGRKYEGTKETAAKWKSFKTTPPGRVPVTIRSVLYRAAQAGWDGSKVKESVFGDLIQWLDGADSATKLMTEGLVRVAAAPMLTATEEEALLQRISSRCWKAYKIKITVPALRKDLKKVRDSVKAQEGKEDTSAPAWALGWCYVTGHDEFYRHRSGEKVKPLAFDRAYSRELLPTEEQLIAAGITVTEAALSRPFLLPAQYLTNTLKVLVVHGYEYDPSKPTQLHFSDDQGKVFANTYARTYPDSDPGTSKMAGDLLQGHLARLIREPEYRRILLDWMAFIVQNPGVKIRWAPLIQGVEGCGKTFLSDCMSTALGARHIKSIGGKAITGGWTEWATGFQLVTLEEMRVVGANRFDVMNTLKPLISNDTIDIAERFEGAREVKNRTNYLALTNFRDAVAITPGDRRYFVIESPMQSKAHINALPVGYFPALYNMLRDQPGGLRHFLETWPVSPTFAPNGAAPATKYREQLIGNSASEAMATVRQLIADSTSCLVQPDLVSISVLFDMMRGEGLAKLTHQGLGKVLLEDGFTRMGRWMLNGTQHNVWAHNSSGLDEAGARDLAVQRADTSLMGENAYLLL